MRFCTELVEIRSHFDRVFDLFSDVSRLPEWAVEYCTAVRSVEGGFVVDSVEGERCIAVRSDRETGVADVCSGASHDRLDDILYIRVIPAFASFTFVQFLYAPAGDVPAEVMKQMELGLKKEIAEAKRILEDSAL